MTGRRCLTRADVSTERLAFSMLSFLQLEAGTIKHQLQTAGRGAFSQHFNCVSLLLYTTASPPLIGSHSAQLPTKQQQHTPLSRSALLTQTWTGAGRSQQVLSLWLRLTSYLPTAAHACMHPYRLIQATWHRQHAALQHLPPVHAAAVRDASTPGEWHHWQTRPRQHEHRPAERSFECQMEPRNQAAASMHAKLKLALHRRDYLAVTERFDPAVADQVKFHHARRCSGDIAALNKCSILIMLVRLLLLVEYPA